MGKDHILRVPLNNNPEQHVLLNVISEKKGSLDLSLEATDGEVVFVGSVYQAQLSKLLKRSKDVSLPEWEGILQEKLLYHGRLLDEDPAVKLELVANISSQQIVIAFRKNISGIHQRIGEIILNKDERHEVDIISWTSTAVERSDSLEQQVKDLSRKLKAHEAGIEKLKAQLEEFQEAKKADEKALLDKFCETLNFKKAKIRDQQFLLSTAKVDKTKAAQIQAARSSRAHHKPFFSRGRKRKPSQSGSDGELSSENMDVEEEGPEKGLDSVSRASTPDKDTADEMSTGSDVEDLDNLETEKSFELRDGETTSNGKARDTGLDETVQPKQTTAHRTPAKRDLPFAKTGQARSATAPSEEPSALEKQSVATPAGDEDDEASDDEL